MACTRTASVGRLIRRFAGRRDGATAIEYALIAGGLSIVIAVTVFAIGGTLRDSYFVALLPAVTAPSSTE
ncbi:Flp family type IVb pilin [Hansschlegelia sp. KR7-227]|jgi:pilus assembly protein Flp/PilA|uniref:Flp family type IVb pilin n=1 Tax=Hansschlegelia sp. KR7-227 TaxID=3400914 RepID=UPI003C08946F